MELTSSSVPIDANATFRALDGSLSYIIEASGFLTFTKKTQIWKIGGSTRAVVAELLCPGDTSKSTDEVVANGRKIMFEKMTDSSSSSVYTFYLNNQSYSWQASLKTAQLTDEFNHTTIATYTKGSKSLFRKSRLSSLVIDQEALPLADEIFATFVLTQQIAARDLVNKGTINIMTGSTGGSGVFSYN